jgi:hypothetical protein
MNANNLEKEISRLSAFPSFQDRIRITIYGNKDSGKTSFINSIIGKELIPIKDEEKEGKIENKKDIKHAKKDNNISEESNKDIYKITQRIFILRNKEDGDTSLCRVNLKKVTDLVNNIHISYNIFGTEEMYTSENALKYGITGEEEIKKFLTQPLVQNNKETKKETLENETIKGISTNTNEISTIKDNEKKEEEKKEDKKEKSIPKFNSLFPDVENEVYIIETKVKFLKEINLPEYIKKKLEFIDIPGQKFPYEITNIIDELMSKTNIYLIFFSLDKNGEFDSKEFEQKLFIS